MYSSQNKPNGLCVLDNLGAASMQRKGSLGAGSMDSYQRKALVSARGFKGLSGPGGTELEGSPGDSQGAHSPQHV